MVKNIIATFTVLILLIFGAVYENNFVSRQFTEYQRIINVLYIKVENETATEEDEKKAKDDWLEKKKYLHAFIPHNEIKEIEIWISEALSMIKNEKWEEAADKMEVLKTLVNEIPSSVIISIQNIL